MSVIRTKIIKFKVWIKIVFITPSNRKFNIKTENLFVRENRIIAIDSGLWIIIQSLVMQKKCKIDN